MTDLDLDLHTPIGHQDDGDDVDLSAAISGLSGAAKRKEIRSVPSAQISEFAINSADEKVRLHELMGTLESNTSTGQLKKQLRNVHRHQKVLATPLNRFEQGALARSAAYEQTSKEVSKWEPIVDKNKKVAQLEFPLQKPSIKVYTGSEFTKKIQPYTPLEREIAELLHGNEHVLPEKGGLTKAEQRALRAMDIEEARQRRAELQKYRALLSYKEARAKRQKKIKSKQFHRILNKERRKQEEKSLEDLKEKDPELLKSKIEKADKNRIQERMSLKHHGGSKKMKQKLIYAKYDKDARLQVDDMLQKSRELKQKSSMESDSEEEVATAPVVDETPEAPKTFSPWTGSVLAGQQNPWLKPSKDAVKLGSYSRPEAIVAAPTAQENGDNDDEADDAEDDVTNDVIPPMMTSRAEEVFVIGGEDTRVQNDEERMAKKREIDTMDNDDENDENLDENDEIDHIFATAKTRDKQKGRRKTKQKKASNAVNSVADENPTGQKTRGGKREKREKGKGKKRKAEEMSTEQDTVVDDSGLTISTERKQTLADMDGLATESPVDAMETSRGAKRRKQEEKKKAPVESKKVNIYDPDFNIYVEPGIDPSNFMKISTKDLRSRDAPLVAEGEDEQEDVSQFDLIAEAFADDDVVDDFAKEKKAVVDRDKPKAIDLTLPGWGSWGGTDIAIPRKKRRKFLIKPPPSAPRRDANKKNVIISETKDKTIAKHQVSWLPRQFKNVYQFESSIRAPIGRTWNPETSFKELTKPKVVTHLGTIIDPMDEGEKFKKQKVTGVPEVGKRRNRKR